MKPVKVRTVQVKAGQVKLASAGSPQPATPITSAIPAARPEVPETSSAVVAKAEIGKAEKAKPEVVRLKWQSRSRHARDAAAAGESRHRQRLARRPSRIQPAALLRLAGDGLRRSPAPRSRRAVQQNGATKPVAAVHTGWIVQVGALESESEALQRIDAARSQARGLLAKADPFTEPVVAKGDKKLFRARFAGLDRDQAEAVCRTLKRSDISCITVRN